MFLFLVFGFEESSITGRMIGEFGVSSGEDGVMVNDIAFWVSTGRRVIWVSDVDPCQTFLI